MAQNRTLNTAELMTGIDGCLSVEVNGKNVPLLEVANYSVVMNFNTVDKQYVGDPLVKRVPTGVSIDLTFTESVVRDDIFMVPILEALRNGKIPIYNFQGVMFKPDGQEERLGLNNCVPNGNFSLQNLTPGEVIERESSFALNEIPQVISSLVSTYLEAV